MTNAGTQIKDAAVGIGIVFGVAFVGYTIWQGRQLIKDNVSTDPNQNIVARGADAAVDVFLSGEQKDLTIGDRLFQFFNPTEAERLCEAGQVKFCQKTEPAVVNEPLPFFFGG